MNSGLAGTLPYRVIERHFDGYLAPVEAPVQAAENPPNKENQHARIRSEISKCVFPNGSVFHWAWQGR